MAKKVTAQPDDPKPGEPNIKRRELTKSLPVKLTDDEKLSYGRQVGKTSQALGEARERKKEYVAQLTAEVEKHRVELERLGTLLANGYEYRDVECIMRIDLDDRMVFVTRMDTGEIIEDRRARPDELQGELPL